MISSPAMADRLANGQNQKKEEVIDVQGVRGN